MDDDTEAVLAAAANPPYHAFPTSEVRSIAAKALATGDTETYERASAALRDRAQRPTAAELFAQYAPDAGAFDALVDQDGAPEPPPTDAQLAQQQMDPIDAVDVVAQLADAVERAEVFLVAGTGSVEDRVLLLSRLGDTTGRLAAVAGTLAERLASDVDKPIEVDGRWWGTGSKKSVRQWDMPAATSAINRHVMRPVEIEIIGDDDEPGTPAEREPTAAEVVERMWRYVSPATGRTAKLREAGITEDDFATVTRVDVVRPEKA